jgi:hypothetical protein
MMITVIAVMLLVVRGGMVVVVLLVVRQQVLKVGEAMAIQFRMRCRCRRTQCRRTQCGTLPLQRSTVVLLVVRGAMGAVVGGGSCDVAMLVYSQFAPSVRGR